MAPVGHQRDRRFVFPNVTPDTYTVEVAMPGSKPSAAPASRSAAATASASASWSSSVGGTAETVTVTAEAPLIQSQSGERSFRITTDEVENLPIGTRRNFAALTSLTPGVTGTTTRLGGGGQNNIMMDGVSTMDTGNNGQLLQMNPEAIAEVKVLTAGYQAEYGRSSGLQITAVTKSGTNQFHGSRLRRHAQLRLELEQLGQQDQRHAEGGRQAVATGATRFGGPVGKPGRQQQAVLLLLPGIPAAQRRQHAAPVPRADAAERAGDFSQSTDQNGNPIPNLVDFTVPKAVSSRTN